MDLHGVVESQLKIAYEGHSKSYEQRANDKRLCLTMWLAIVGFVSSKHVLPVTGVILVTASPILMFWILDGARAVYTRLWSLKIAGLEILLLREHFDVSEVQPLLFASGVQYSLPEKLKTLLTTMFGMESVFAFYLFLGLMNVAFVFLYATTK